MRKASVAPPLFSGTANNGAVKAAAAPAKPTYRIVEVTPALAEKWLAQNTHNRNLRDNKVMSYARDMEAGMWQENGEAIKFSAAGVLLDGQHRLHAIALSRVTLPMLVITGLAGAAQETMDDGAKRTLADALNLRGEKNATTLGSTIRRTLLWNAGYTSAKSAYSPTNSECLTFLEEHPELRESADVASALRKPSKVPGAALGLTHWVFNQIDAADAAWFFEHLGSGAGIEQYHPVWTLRKRFAEEWSSQSRLSEEFTIVFLIKGWNAFRDGEEIKILRYKPGGALPEKFPMPH